MKTTCCCIVKIPNCDCEINVELNEPASRNVGQQPLGRHYSRCEPQRKFNLHNSKSVILREQVICVYLIPLFDFNHRVMVQITGRNSISRLKKNRLSDSSNSVLELTCHVTHQFLEKIRKNTLSSDGNSISGIYIMLK